MSDSTAILSDGWISGIGQGGDVYIDGPLEAIEVKVVVEDEIMVSEKVESVED